MQTIYHLHVQTLILYIDRVKLFSQVHGDQGKNGNIYSNTILAEHEVQFITLENKGDKAIQLQTVQTCCSRWSTCAEGFITLRRFFNAF